MAGAVLSATVGVTVLAGCGLDGGPPTDPTGPTDPVQADTPRADDLEDRYDGPFTEAFRDDIERYLGLEVSLLGEVRYILSPIAFTLGGADDGEPILVITHEELGELSPGQTVAVVAVPGEEFRVVEMERAIGSDLPDEAYADWEGQPFLDASDVQPRS